MLKTLTIIAGITVGLPLAAAAEPTAEYAIRNKEVPIMQGFIVGMGRGFEWANANLANRNQPRLYCPPDKLAMVGEQYVGMLEDYVKKLSDAATLPAGSVLLRALQGTFPCK